MAQGQGLDKDNLIVDIKQLFKDMRSIEDNEEAENKYAETLANIIEKYVKTGKVVTVGSASAQQGYIV